MSALRAHRERASQCIEAEHRVRTLQVDLVDRGCLVARLAARHDRIQPVPVAAHPRQVGGGAPDAREGIPVGHLLQVGDPLQAVARTGPAGVDQLDATGHGLQLVSIKMALTAVTGCP